MTGRIVERTSVRKRVRRWLAAGGLSLSLGAGVAAGALHWGALPTYEVPVPAYALPATADPARGRGLVTMLCWSCHFDPATGALSGRRLAPRMVDFGEVVSTNITQDEATGIGTWSAGEIAFLLRSGVDPRSGEYVPPYMPKFPRTADADLADMIAFLQSEDPWVVPVQTESTKSEPSFQSKLLARTRWEPLEVAAGAIDAPPRSEPDRYGDYLVNDLLLCHRCHSADPTNVDFEHPVATPGYLGGGSKLYDEGGRFVYSTNLTSDDAGLGRWSYAEFRDAILGGRDPQGKVLRWPMPRYTELGEREVEAIFAYLQSVAPRPTRVPAAESYKSVPEMLDPGKFQFYRLGCQTCHPQQSVGLGSLDQLDASFDSDDELAAFVREPRSVRPRSVMPAYRDQLDAEALAHLVAYLRQRSAADP